MSEKIGEALLDLDTNDGPFKAGVRRAQRVAEDFGKMLDDVGQRALKLGKTLALAAGAAGLAFFAKGIYDAVGRLENMRKMSAQVDQALANSGNTAKTSAQEIGAWADALEARTGRAAEDVMAVSANLASYGFGREEFYRAIELANDMAAAWGGDLKQNLEGLGRALDDPVNGMAMLSKRGIKLTDDQKAMAAAFLDAGDKASAQKVVFEALEAQVKGVAEAGFGGLTKALAQGRKVWEDAFEALVTGDGQASDLSKTMEQLIATLSSPDFVAAVMGIGTLVVQVINVIAGAVIAGYNAIRQFKDFLAASDQEVSDVALKSELAGLDKLYAEAHAKVQTLPTLDPERDKLGNQMQNWLDRMDVIKAELDRRVASAPAVPVIPFTPLNPVGGGAGGGAGAPTTKAAEEMKATTDATQEQTDAIERQQAAYDALGDVGKTALQGIVAALKDGKIEGTELLGILGNLLSQAGQFFFQQAGQGGGAGKLLSDIFAGFFADGGLIPNGSFGIVGENGPEPIWGGAGGTHVMSNPDFMGLLGSGPRGDTNITINGSGLSQSELTQAISDAVSRFSRFELPGRVRDINADPLARG